MKYLLYIILFIGCASCFVSCTSVSGVGALVMEDRDVSGFTKVEHAISGDVIIEPGAHFALSIEAQKNILDVLETTVDHGILKIRFKPNTMITRHKKITVHISMPEIEGLTLTGSGDMQINQPFSAENIELKLTGSGNMKLSALATNNLEADLTGSGTIRILSGHAAAQELDIRGSGSMDMENLESRKSDVDIAGSGDARLNVQEVLKVRITGSGNVYYSGKPRLESHITGSGDINAL